MTTLQIINKRGTPVTDARQQISVAQTSLGVSATAMEIDSVVGRVGKRAPVHPQQPSSASLQEQLFNSLASFKIFVSQVAMYLDDEWRARLFRQLDNLIDYDEWDPADLPPQLASFASFLRWMLSAKPEVRPGLGATGNGHLVAAWTSGQDKLTIEFLPADEARWSIAVTNDEERERAAGFVSISRICDVVAPYRPERWLKRA